MVTVRPPPWRVRRAVCVVRARTPTPPPTPLYLSPLPQAPPNPLPAPAPLIPRRALTPPGYFPDWIVGVRFKATGKLVACITGVPASMVLHKAPVTLCEINFLCIHKKLRAKRLAPVLIKEVRRAIRRGRVTGRRESSISRPPRQTHSHTHPPPSTLAPVLRR